MTEDTWAECTEYYYDNPSQLTTEMHQVDSAKHMQFTVTNQRVKT